MSNTMDWLIDSDWSCEICGNTPLFIGGMQVGSGLKWSIAHGVCYCEQCHASYAMRDPETKEVTTTPVPLTKESWKEVMKKVWIEQGKPIEELEEDELRAEFESLGFEPPSFE